MIFGSCIDIIVVLLSESILTNSLKVVLLFYPHGLHQFGTKPSFEASDSLCFRINKFWGIPCQMIECMQRFSKTLGALYQLHEFSVFHGHQARRNIMPLESLLELIPSDLGILR